jgi:outer membrane scaffolding protein for murein synthesis (MipA/OmpV family)
MTNPEGAPGRRTATALIAAAATFASLASGSASAQPTSVGGVAVGAEPGARMNLTVGVGPAVAPDYEGSDDFEIVPFFNLRVGNLYHPETYVQVLGARLISNFVPSDHWRLGIAGQFIRERDDVEDDRVDDLKSVDASVLLGLIGGYDFLATLQHDLVIEGEARQDVAGDNGFLGSLRLRYGSLFSERWRLDTLVGTSWASEDYMSSTAYPVDSAAYNIL